MPASQQLPDPAFLRAIAKERGITQSVLAKVIGVNQSQVSRMLAAKTLKATPKTHKLCEWVMRSSRPTSTADVLQNTELIGAVAFAWDGSPQHASALALVIRSLRVLERGPVAINPKE